MSGFKMWEDEIVFQNGWFIYKDGKGNNSVISHNRARKFERGYNAYQASMDVGRGGEDPDKAYSTRGFTKIDGEYVYQNYRVDEYITGDVEPTSSVVVVPKSINGIRINCICREAFKSETSIEKVILSKNIKKIGESAFEGCVNLKEIEIPNKNVIVDANAFKDTALYGDQGIMYLKNTLIRVNPSESGAVEIKKGTTSIAEDAFKDCSEITDVIFPKGLISIGKNAFSGCKKIQKLVLPQSLRCIEEYAFSDCTNLQTVILPKTMDKIDGCAFSGCKSIETITLPDEISEIARGLFSECECLKSVNIPKSVMSVSSNAFTDCGLFKSYKESSDEAFYIDNWLIDYKWKETKNLCVREGTIGIAEMWWIEATKLTTLTLPNSLKFIQSGVFEKAPITSVKLPPNLQYIGRSAFRGTQLKEVVIPASVKKIEQWAFMNCENIESITIKGTKTVIDDGSITGRKDKKPIIIFAPKKSKAKKYCREYGERYNLIFKPIDESEV